jgi:hypothetical protein
MIDNEDERKSPEQANINIKNAKTMREKHHHHHRKSIRLTALPKSARNSHKGSSIDGSKYSYRSKNESFSAL